MLRAHFGLPSVESEEGEGRPPIKVQFEIPYFTTSGIQVRIYKLPRNSTNKLGFQQLCMYCSAFRCAI